MFKYASALTCAILLLATTSHAQEKSRSTKKAAAGTSTCTGRYPSYFQDPAFDRTDMWGGQVTINKPTANWRGPVFSLSDAYGKAVPEKIVYPWLKFNPFDPKLSTEEKTRQARQYIWAVMHYIQEGNINSGDVDTDWTLCNNKVRKWFHIPYQTYDPLTGREFVHGLTREAPVTMALNGGLHQFKTTMWAVGFYNPAAAQTLSTVWTGASAPKLPTQDVRFNEGSVIGKLLFTTATSNEFPYLTNLPVWRANISAPDFCICKPSSGSVCTFAEQTEQCPRTVGDVYLLQFDIAVRDSRSPIGWTYGTFVADGQRKSGERNPWNRISPQGLMWGNDTPPVGTGALNFPTDPRKNGFKDGVIFWDVVDMLNQHTGAGHLGCNGRLNGPADNAQSSCLSCHQTASVPDSKNTVPALVFQFNSKTNGECMPNPQGLNLEIDQTYFKNFTCGTPFTGPASVVPPPAYKSGGTQWIGTDFSLQLSISLVQWQEWMRHQQESGPRKFHGTLPNRAGN